MVKLKRTEGAEAVETAAVLLRMSQDDVSAGVVIVAELQGTRHRQKSD